ncbi:hypothetical protein AA637_13900 [Cyanobacterium sp. HL-69]|nr:hypothetical protein AA637_13900 [Cyanobacterium sp. HL-69]
MAIASFSFPVRKLECTFMFTLEKEGEAKFWLEPQIELARNHNLSRKHLKAIETIIEERQNELRNAWTKHFSG